MRGSCVPAGSSTEGVLEPKIEDVSFHRVLSLGFNVSSGLTGSFLRSIFRHSGVRKGCLLSSRRVGVRHGVLKAAAKSGLSDAAELLGCDEKLRPPDLAGL